MSELLRRPSIAGVVKRDRQTLVVRIRVCRCDFLRDHNWSFFDPSLLVNDFLSEPVENRMFELLQVLGIERVVHVSVLLLEVDRHVG